MTDELSYEVRDRAAFLTIRREARRNALSPEIIAAFGAFLDQAAADPAVWAVCITGAGEKAFCAGADLGGALDAAPGGPPRAALDYAALLGKMLAYGKPLVARVNGPCLAGGMGLMLGCHLVLARDDAFFSLPEVNVGIFPMMVGALLLRNVGRKKALEMVLTGRKVGAAEAERIGLITRAVPAEALDAEVEELLALMATRSPIGVKIGLEAFHAMSDLPVDEALTALCAALGRSLDTEDAREGMRAFMEKRRPEFKGR
ncbi:MAG: enoyl-CoA hydratase-related protein [Pseudomonadota bacterium]